MRARTSTNEQLSRRCIAILRSERRTGADLDECPICGDFRDQGWPGCFGAVTGRPEDCAEYEPGEQVEEERRDYMREFCGGCAAGYVAYAVAI